MPKKKFIDKKKAVTFHLVHRSQRDPLQADEDASKRVLLPTQESKKENRKEEQHKYGIMFDDEYDYLQHLKDTQELNDVEPLETFRVYAPSKEKKKEPQIHLPSSVFATDVETDVGLLNKAAPLRGPQPDWDPDIVEALDDDYDFDNPSNQLDDDFFSMANADELPAEYTSEKPSFRPPIEVCSDEEEDDDDDCYPSDEAEMSDEGDNVSEVGSLGQHSFMSAETKTRFTNYSMTSSVMRRNEGLTLLDDRFEQLFEQYDDTEIGALDQEDIAGFIHDDSRLMKDALEQWEKTNQKITMKDIVEKGTEIGIVSDSEGSDCEIIEVTDTKPEEKWDCESILSTYSTLYNHPKKIVEPSKKSDDRIKFTKRLGIPQDVLEPKGLTLKQLEKEQRQERLHDQVPTYRPKQETAEDKRARKQAVKEQRRERREEKKMNKKAFKTEEIRQQKELINLNKNLKAVKIV